MKLSIAYMKIKSFRLSHRFKQLVLVLTVVGLPLSASNAALVTLSGTTVDFTFDDSLTGLFGIPSVVSDNLVFNPTEFSVTSSNGEGIQLTNSTFNVLINARDGLQFNDLTLTERGDYLLSSQSTSANVRGQLRVQDHSNNPLLETTDFLALSNPLDIKDDNLHNWEAEAKVSLANNAWNGVNQINATIENLLSASTSEIGTLAFVEKKLVALSVTTIPIPAAVWLFGSGLIGLLVVARRQP